MSEIIQAVPVTEDRPLSAVEIRGQVNLIQEVMREVMQEGQHYGKIPGCGDKPTLLKPGAEKLCLTFRLAPAYQVTTTRDREHLELVSSCTLTHIPTGRLMGTGMGSCSTRESRYAWRQASRKCPTCGKETIIKGKDEYGGGWLCFAKKGGCGAKWGDGAKEIESQSTGRTPNEDLADQYNTVLKMANKRSLVAAVLNVTAASDIFTQDIEDIPLVIPDGPVVVDAKATVKEPAKEPQKPAPTPTKENGGKKPVTGKTAAFITAENAKLDKEMVNVGEFVKLEGHACSVCTLCEWTVKAGRAESANPGRRYLACKKGCQDSDFGGWVAEVMAKYARDGASNV